MRPMFVLGCLAAAVSLWAGVAAGAPPSQPGDCSSKLKALQAAKDLADVKLEEEIERADAQIYLTRLELSITKRKLAETAAKCGAACAPPTPSTVLK